jgi:hypothetical protein
VASGALGVGRISNMMITHNNAGLTAVAGASIISFGNNRIIANNTNNGPATLTPGQQ